MIIKNIKVKNEYIDISASDIEFESCGIYLIHGENGSGKTSFIRDIVFNNVDIDFSDEPSKEAYDNKRGCLFSYVPQEIPSSTLSVKDFVFLGQTGGAEIGAINNEFRRLLIELGLEGIMLNTQVHKLSGGERTKLCIISALLKETPYIFMDEPTNNLDDGSVHALIRILNEYSEKKTLILCSHDTRLNVNALGELLVTRDNIIKKIYRKVNLNENILNHIKINRFHLALAFLKNKVNILAVSSIILCLAAMIYADNFICSSAYAMKEDLKPDSILVYLADNAYGELNEKYCRMENIKPEGNISRRISFSDIPEIAKIKDVKNIYIMRDDMYSEIYDILDGVGDGEIVDISIPYDGCVNYSSVIGLQEVLVLKAGRAPRDNMNEIALPESEVDTIAKDNNHSPNKVIGHNIVYNNKQYKLCGITASDFAWRSFSEGDDITFYTYNKRTFFEYRRCSIKYRKKEAFTNERYIDNMIITTDKGREKTVLNKLISKYPADNFSSRSFDEIYTGSENEPLMVRLMLLNIFISVILSGIIHTMNRNQFGEDRAVMEHIDNFYIKKGLGRSIYISAHACETVVVSFAMFLIGINVLGQYPGMSAVFGSGILIMTVLMLLMRRAAT